MIDSKQTKKMDIKILGTGCSKCNKLEQITRDAVAEAGVDANISKVDDILEIMSFGIMTTPALVIDEKVVVKGRVPSVKEIMKILTA